MVVGGSQLRLIRRTQPCASDVILELTGIGAKSLDFLEAWGILE
jgi:hypothetical protein